jgi:hypothetical protein
MGGGFRMFLACINRGEQIMSNQERKTFTAFAQDSLTVSHLEQSLATVSESLTTAHLQRQIAKPALVQSTGNTGNTPQGGATTPQSKGNQK